MNSSQVDATTHFIRHFTSPDVGGSVHPALEPRNDPLTGLSMFSKSPIPANERLITCPASLVVTPEIARSALETLYGGVSRKGKGKEVDLDLGGWKETMLLCGYICLHWIHHDLGSLPDCLGHWAYIASLPPAETLRTPLHFTESEMALLAGTNLHGATLDRQKQWREEYDVVRSVIDDDGMTWDRYLTAATYISSRAFPSKLLKMAEEGVKETNAVQTSAEEESHPVLIPGMDIFNHSRGQPITWLSSLDSDTQTPTISLVTPSNLEADVQVFNNYGPKPNEELLLGYGFVLDPNPDEVVPLRLGGLGTNVSPAKKARLASKNLDPGRRWIIKRDGQIERDLMEVLRIVMGPEETHTHDHDEDEDEDEEEEHGHWEEEMELELDVLSALGQMLEDKLIKLEAVEVSGEVREDVRDMCAVYRRGQVENLEKAMETIEERIDRVERLTAEGQGCPCCN